MSITLNVDDKVKFYGEKQRYTVQAVSSDGRFAACTKPFNPRRTVIYTMVDTVYAVRGVDNTIGNSLGYRTREDCERAVALFERGEFEFSHRKRPIPLHVDSINGERVAVSA